MEGMQWMQSNIKTLSCLLFLTAVAFTGQVYGYTMSDVRSGITVQTDSQVAISLNYRVNSTGTTCTNAGAASGQVVADCYNALIVGFGTAVQNMHCIANSSVANRPGVINWSVRAPSVPGVYDIWVANRTGSGCAGISYASLSNQEKRVIGAAKLTVFPPACPMVRFNNSRETNWKTTAETNAHGNANWDSVSPGMSGSMTVTGRCRPGWQGVPSRTCTLTQTSNGAASVWGAVSNPCQLRRCSATNGYDDGKYDCDWSAATVYHASFDRCSYKPTLEPTRHHNRALCCTENGWWWGPYPDAEEPAGAADCTWRDQGNLPYRY